MKKLMFLVIAMLAMATGIAYAGVDWCPTFVIEGTKVNVVVSLDQQPAGPIQLTVVVPKDVEASVEPYDENLWEVKIVHTDHKAKGKDIDVKVILLVPDDGGEHFDVRVVVTVEGGNSKTKDGHSGHPIVLKKVRVPKLKP